jgi:hypothetical protein
MGQKSGRIFPRFFVDDHAPRVDGSINVECFTLSNLNFSRDQKLNTFASMARSIRCGPPSSTMLEKKFFSST